MTSPPPRQRRSLTNVGGEVTVRGDREAGALLAEALDVAPSVVDEAEAQAHVHGFHPYPARMHPRTARRLVEAFSRPLAAVLDPFCGSGTVLVETRLAGRFAAGVDANPLAVRLARLKATTTTDADRAALTDWARKIAATADTRREARAGASRLFPHADVALFAPHVLLELDGLRVGLEGFKPRTPEETWAREALWLVRSAILTKVSRRTSETSDTRAPRRLFAGYVAKLFAKKADDLAARLAEIAPQLKGAPGLWVEEGDARVLEGVDDGAVDLTVTSPPYAGIYDYVAHHEARLRWLGMDDRPFRRREIGARERFSDADPDEGREAWDDELGAVLRSLRRATKPGGHAVLLLADSVVGGSPIFADDAVYDLSHPCGFEPVAVASQERTHFHAKTSRAFADRPRCEHALLLRADLAKPRQT
ncbi:MAG: DNA methyltransferase [Polyangiaceae bacterium]